MARGTEEIRFPRLRTQWFVWNRGAWTGKDRGSTFWPPYFWLTDGAPQLRNHPTIVSFNTTWVFALPVIVYAYRIPILYAIGLFIVSCAVMPSPCRVSWWGIDFLERESSATIV